MRELTLDHFAPGIGETWEVAAPGGPVPLVLAAAEPLASSGRAGGSFRLEFEGPPEPLLPQAIYGFARGGEEDEIFIVPIGLTDDKAVYEAIFF